MRRALSALPRVLLAAALALPLFAAAGAAPARAAAASSPDGIAQAIADHFSSVKTMTGEFVQFGPKGEQTGGKFYLARPGRIRFNYEAPGSFKVIADGKSVVINNPRLRTWDLYSLSQTPLRLLLSEHIDLSGGKVSDVRQEADQITLVLNDSSVLGKSRITMIFDPKTYDLKQWTIRDPQGKDTTVMVFNVQQGVAVDDDLFKIDYRVVMKSVKPEKTR